MALTAIVMGSSAMFQTFFVVSEKSNTGSGSMPGTLCRCVYSV